ncbi:MFS quinate transporter QutD [Xylariaceae sp. FL0016]|nr:MFS quinate transporter QutD [Xylariaceae sp. FL0016]
MKNSFAIREDPKRPVPKEAYGWRIYALAASAAWASAMFGYDSAFIGGTLSLPSFQTSFGLSDADSTLLTSNIVSTFQAGCFFGSLGGYPVAEKLGRRANLIASGVIFAVGAIVQILSGGRVAMMYAGRVLTGLGVGASSMVVPIYIAEAAPPTIRGRLVGVFENLAPSVRQWQIPFAVQLIPAGLLVLCMAFMVESPRWLVKRGRHESASRSLCWARNLPADHPYIQHELAEMRSQLEMEEAFDHGTNKYLGAWKELISKGVRRRIIMAVCIKFAQNFAGVNALNYYSPSIFKSIGFTGTSTGLLATGVYGIVKAAVTLIYITWLVDSGSFDGGANRDGGAYMAMVAIYAYAGSYAFSWNSFPWIFASEIFPTKIRTLAMLITISAQRISQFIIIYATPFMIKNITYGTFYFFGSCIFVSAVCVYCFVPETKGFTLETMHLLFQGSMFAPKARRDAVERLQSQQAEDTENIAVVAGKRDASLQKRPSSQEEPAY